MAGRAEARENDGAKGRELLQRKGLEGREDSRAGQVKGMAGQIQQRKLANQVQQSTERGSYKPRQGRRRFSAA